MKTKASVTTSEKRLLSRFTLEHYSIYMKMRDSFERCLLDFIATYIRYFTSHGKKHSEGIIQQISCMLPDSVLETFSSSEMLVLLSSIWLHDIGLLVNRDPLTGYEIDDNNIRNRHHELSEQIIIRHHKEFCIEDPVIASLIGRVVFCHRKKVDIEQIFLEDAFVIANDKIRPRFLSALLRLGDALDNDWRRAPSLVMDKFTLLPDESYLHWVACKIISVGYSYNDQDSADNAIYITGTANIDLNKDLSVESIEDIFYWKLEDIRCEFSGVKSILQKNGLKYYGIKGILLSKNEVTHIDEEIKRKVKDVQIILLERELVFHDTNKNYIFSADTCYRVACFYEKSAKENTDKRKISYEASAEFFKKAYQYVLMAKKEDAINKFRYGLYYYNFLAKYFALKGKEQTDNIFVPPEKTLTPPEQHFIEHGDKIMLSFDYLENNSIVIDSFDYLIVMLKSARSPLRKKLQKALDAHYSKIETDKDNSEFASVHDGCCMCTSELLLEFALSKRHMEKDIIKCKNWLKDQKKDDWMSHYGNKRSISYTAYVLDAYMSMDDSSSVNDAVKVIIDAREHIRSKIYSIDYYEYLGQMFRHVSRFLNCIDVEKRSEMLSSFFDDSSFFYKIFKDYLSPTSISCEPYDIINYMMVKVDDDFYKNIFGIDREIKLFEIIKGIFNDKMWVQDSSWAYNPRETLFRIRCLIDFWEYYLEDEQATLDKYYNFCKENPVNSGSAW